MTLYTTYTVSKKDHEGQRLDRFVAQHYPGVPYHALQKALRKGHIRKIPHTKSQGQDRLSMGDTVMVHPSFHDLFVPSATPPVPKVSRYWHDTIRSLVLYEDDDILALNKPQGIASQGGSKQPISLDVVVKNYHPESRLVHRLDKETSGVLLLAKSLHSARVLTKAFQEGTIDKVYVGVVHGCPENDRGIIDHPIFDPQRQKDLSALTHYEVLESTPSFSKVMLYPKTGRMHQLRRHMSALGHPILGDTAYGSSITTHMHLHCFRMTLPCGRMFQADLPAYFDRIVTGQKNSER